MIFPGANRVNNLPTDETVQDKETSQSELFSPITVSQLCITATLFEIYNLNIVYNSKSTGSLEFSSVIDDDDYAASMGDDDEDGGAIFEAYVLRIRAEVHFFLQKEQGKLDLKIQLLKNQVNMPRKVRHNILYKDLP